MTLYEINQAILELGHVDEETGEFFIDEAALNALQMERENKLESVICWVKNLKAENAAIKAERDALDSRMKVNTNRINSLTKYLADALCGEKFKTARCTVSYRASTSVAVEEDKLPKKWMRVSYSPDKTAIKEWLKAGHKIKGASLQTNTNMVIK